MRRIALFGISFAAAVYLALLVLPGKVGLIAAGALALLSPLCLILKGRRRTAAFIAVAGLAVGLVWTAVYSMWRCAPAEELDGRTENVAARVISIPRRTGYGGYADVKLKASGVTVRTRIYAYDDGLSALRPGDTVTFTGNFTLAGGSGEESASSFASRGVFLIAGNAREVTLTERAKSSLPYLHLYLADAIRNKVAELFPPSSSHIVTALLTGDKTELYKDSALVSDLERSGVIHILSVSGMHVSILSGLLLALLGRRRRGILTASLVILLFAAVCGFTAGVTRALVMQLSVMAALWFGRESDSLTALALSGLLILILNPFAALGVGFQLSFAATFGIIVIAPRVDAAIPGQKRGASRRGALGRMLHSLRVTAATSVGAAVMTAPLTAIHFGTVSLVAPITNILLLWLVTPLFALSILAAGAGFIFVPAGKLAAIPPALIARLIASGARMIAEPFFAAVYVDYLPLTLCLSAVWGGIIAALLLEIPIRRLVSPACIAVIAVSLALIANILAGDGHVGFTMTVLDVGQGQCIVLTSGSAVAVIDCGSSSGEDAAEAAERYLRGIGRDYIDVFILTHFHADHMNGAEKLISTIPASAVVAPPPELSDGSDGGEAFLDTAKRLGAELITVAEDMTAELNGVVFAFYAPMGSATENERGICVLISDGDYDALVTGDIASPLELELLVTEDIPDIECLVVGHHGSSGSTSSFFLQQTSPETAIISVGENNYGHPSDETLKRLADRGIEVFRTDEDGNVAVRAG